MKRLGPIFLIALVAAGFLWRVFVFGECPWFGDVIAQFMPWKMFAREELLAGRIPLWNPYHFSGAPFLANMQSAVLYPIDLLLLPFPVARAFGLSLWIHTALAGIFAYLFVRDFRVSMAGSIFGALAFMFGGFFMIHIFAGNLLTAYAAAWIPLMLLLGKRAGEWARRRGRLREALPLLVWGGPVAALQILAGHPQMTFYSFFFATVLAALVALIGGERDGQDGRCGGRLNRGGRALAGVVLLLLFGTGLAAVQIMPTTEFALHSSRSEALSYEEAAQFTFSPDRMIEFLVPEFFGTRYLEPDGAIRNTFWAPVWGAVVFEGKWVVNWKNWSSVYVGGFAFLLGLFGMFSGVNEADPVRRLKLPLLAFAALALLLSFGPHTPVFRAFFFLPGFQHFRAPSKFTPYVIAVLCVFIGRGFDRALEDAKRIDERWRFGRFWAPALGVIAGLGILCLVLKEVGPALEDGRPAAEWTWFVSLRAFAFAGLGGLVLLGLRKRCMSVPVAAAAIVILHGSEMMWLGGKYLTLGKPDWGRVSAVRDAVKEIGVDFTEPARFITDRNLGPAEGWSIADMEVVSGYDPMQVEDYVEYIAQAEGWDSAGFVDNLAVRKFSAPAYDFLNVRWVIEPDPRSIEEAGNVRLLGILPGFAVGERDPYPRAFWVADDDVAEGPTGSELMGVDKETAREHRAEYTRPNPREILLRVNSPEAGYVFLSEVFYPGWKAEEVSESGNGGGVKKLPIRKVNGLFRLIPVEAGEQALRVSYRPFSFTFGMIASILAGIAWLVLLIWWKGTKETTAQGANV
jgi:hypothetical protein